MIESLGPVASLKLDLLFEGLRYTDSLGAAAERSFPNFYPYRFAPGEHDPTGEGKVEIPYMLRTADGTMVRIKGAAESPWHVMGSAADGYRLLRDGGGEGLPIEFEPRPQWMQATTSDGFPMAQTGVSLHGDMAVINVAPGCEYFLQKQQGVSMRCTFCAYGAPDKRTQHLGQVAGVTSLPTRTYHRLGETLRAVIAESAPRHLYLVAGSLTDWREEGKRYFEIAGAVQDVNERRIPVACGSGALPDDCMEALHRDKLVDSVSFNLEVWSQPLFSKICPGKDRYVGYERWIRALEYAVGLWGRGRVYSAMVAGIELEPEFELDWQQAADLAIAGAEDLCSRGITPIYSLYWPIGGRDHPEYLSRLRSYFERLMIGYRAVRERHGVEFWDGFMCRRCAYMQMECDIDAECAAGGSAS
ncbi:MAG: hypothetical protein R3E82_17860 [Pseudomonadales bacterium]